MIDLESKWLKNYFAHVIGVISSLPGSSFLHHDNQYGLQKLRRHHRLGRNYRRKGISTSQHFLTLRIRHSSPFKLHAQLASTSTSSHSCYKPSQHPLHKFVQQVTEPVARDVHGSLVVLRSYCLTSAFGSPRILCWFLGFLSLLVKFSNEMKCSFLPWASHPFFISSPYFQQGTCVGHVF